MPHWHQWTGLPGRKSKHSRDHKWHNRTSRLNWYFLDTTSPKSDYTFFFKHIQAFSRTDHILRHMVTLDKGQSPLDSKEIQPVHPKGNQSWLFTERTDAEAETLILWPPDAKNQLIWKDPDAGKDWRWEEKGTTEDKMFGWHHQLNGHEFE